MPMQQGDSSIGQVIDGYRILGVLGKGGMGIVYKAEDIALSRVVAIKMIAPELVSNEAFLRRFQSEARALARVESPYIVGVHALRQVDDKFFIVMEFVDGWTLADEIEKDMLELPRTRTVLSQMLQAFARAHSVGVIHRDIKPRNIMINRAGRVKVTDFGLAKLRKDDGKSTVTQGVAGTARYMSPEQVLGTSIDHRSDLYSLGMTLYEMLAGVLPFGVEEGTFSILKRIVEEELPSPLQYNPNIPQPLVDIVQKAIRKDPADRFQSAQEMMQAVEAAFQAISDAFQQVGAQGTAGHVSPQQLEKKSNRKPLMIAGLVAVVLLAFPVSKLFLSSETSDNDPPSLANQLPVEGGNGSESVSDLTELLVYSIPPGASVVIDQQAVGVASQAGLSVEVPEGSVTVAFNLEGYEPKDTLVTVSALAANRIEVPLSRIQHSGAGQTIPNTSPNTTTNTTNGAQDPPSVATGKVNLRVEPAGRIAVNGSSYTNSTSIDLPVGVHQVRFEDPATGSVANTRIQVNAGSTVSRTCYFQHKMSIQIRWASPSNAAIPWANIFLNGENIGPTPLGDYELNPGTYTIELRRNGFDISEPQQIVVEPTFDAGETSRKVFFTIAKAQ